MHFPSSCGARLVPSGWTLCRALVCVYRGETPRRTRKLFCEPRNSAAESWSASLRSPSADICTTPRRIKHALPSATASSTRRLWAGGVCRRWFSFAPFRNQAKALDGGEESECLSLSVPPRQVQFLYGPAALYSATAFLIRSSERRLLLSTLYIGTAAQEQRLAELLRIRVEKARASRDAAPFRVGLLFDFLRGTRPDGKGGSSASLVSRVLSTSSEAKDCCQVRLFQNPLTAVSPPRVLRSLIRRTRRLQRRCAEIEPAFLGASGRLLFAAIFCTARRALVAVERNFRSLCSRLDRRSLEALGTQHMKFVVADDVTLLTGKQGLFFFISLGMRAAATARKAEAFLFTPSVRALLSGANFSAEYFTSRTDRAVLIRSREVADFVEAVFEAVAAHSFGLEKKAAGLSSSQEETPIQRQTKLVWKSRSPRPTVNAEAFRTSLASALREALRIHRNKAAETDARASPSLCRLELALQAGFAEPPLKGQAALLQRILQTATRAVETAGPDSGVSVLLTSPYLNFPSPLLRALCALFQQVRSSPFARMQLATASPAANSFLNSKGLSFYIPGAYAVLARKTLRAFEAAAPARSEAATLVEFRRLHWTFHAKGVWVLKRPVDRREDKASSSVSGVLSTRDFLKASAKRDGADAARRQVLEGEAACRGASSIIGSSNLSQRSERRDLELLVLLETNDASLSLQLERETQDAVLFHCKPVSEKELKRRAPFWLPPFVWIFQSLL